MIKNLINETDYSLIKKTNFFYIFFQFSVFLFFIIICFKLFYIISFSQKINLDNKDQYIISPRILDTNGNVLAHSVVNHQIKVENYDSIIKNNDKNNLIKDVKVIDRRFAEKINSITRNSFYIDRNPNQTKVLESIYLGNQDIKFESYMMREYPFKKYTDHTIGTKNFENIGISLIEKNIDNYSQDLNLSIDIDIQKKSYQRLHNSLIKYDADYAIFILVDLIKEEIIVNNFIFNENKNLNFDKTLMPSIRYSYEFGSVFKPFTVYSALKNNYLDLEENFDVHKPLKFYSGSKLIEDFSPSDKPLKTKDILKKSSNKGAVLINRKINCENEFKLDLESLGLLNSMNIMNNIKTIDPTIPKKFSRRGNYCDNLAFGYAMQVTPMHLINAYSKMVTGKMDFNATIVKTNSNHPLRINNHSYDINKLLFYANESKHELYNQLLVAGKTGTAEKKIKKDRKFNNVSYISYFPYNEPRYLALTFMSHPRNADGPKLTAGNTVKNTFYDILDKIILSLDLSFSLKKVQNI